MVTFLSEWLGLLPLVVRFRRFVYGDFQYGGATFFTFLAEGDPCF